MKKRMKAILADRGRPAEPASPPVGPNPVAKPFAIGSLELSNRLVQAPLAGIANWAFRRQSRRHGAGLTVSEMVSSFGVFHGNQKTTRMLRIVADEHPVGVQVFGAHPEVMAEAARAAEAAGADLVDINMGCPVSKVCKTGAGAKMLDDPDAAARVIEAMARAVAIPVTAKMRRGMTPATSRPAETARRLESAGAAAICLHPRAAAEEYGGHADHRITAEVVAAVSVPVIASGDIDSAAAARRVMEETGCAAVAIGRAALGNPWVFGEILAGAARPRPALDEVVDEVERFAADLREAVGDDRAGAEMRKFYPWYLAGHDVPKEEIDALLVAPGLDAALGRLRALRAEPLAA